MVAASNGGISNAPIGPFQIIAEQRSRKAVATKTDSAPASKIISPSATSSLLARRCAAPSLNSTATTTSWGSRIWQLCTAATSIIRRAVSTMFGSASEAPIGFPFASKNVLAIPPPSTSPSTLVTRFSNKASFDDTFAPPTTAPSGRTGDDNAAFNASSSAAKDRPAADGIKRGKASTDACARCAQEKASPT